MPNVILRRFSKSYEKEQRYIITTNIKIVSITTTEINHFNNQTS